MGPIPIVGSERSEETTRALLIVGSDLSSIPLQFLANGRLLSVKFQSYGKKGRESCNRFRVYRVQKPELCYSKKLNKHQGQIVFAKILQEMQEIYTSSGI